MLTAGTNCATAAVSSCHFGLFSTQLIQSGWSGAGDAIDTSLGVTLGISTLAAAGLGNLVSDVAGKCIHQLLQSWCHGLSKLIKRGEQGWGSAIRSSLVRLGLASPTRSCL